MTFSCLQVKLETCRPRTHQDCPVFYVILTKITSYLQQLLYLYPQFKICVILCILIYFHPYNNFIQNISIRDRSLFMWGGDFFCFSIKEKTWPTPLWPLVNSWPTPILLYIRGDPPPTPFNLYLYKEFLFTERNQHILWTSVLPVSYTHLTLPTIYSV